MADTAVITAQAAPATPAPTPEAPATEAPKTETWEARSDRIAKKVFADVAKAKAKEAPVPEVAPAEDPGNEPSKEDATEGLPEPDKKAVLKSLELLTRKEAGIRDAERRLKAQSEEFTRQRADYEARARARDEQLKADPVKYLEDAGVKWEDVINKQLGKATAQPSQLPPEVAGLARELESIKRTLAEKEASAARDNGMRAYEAYQAETRKIVTSDPDRYAALAEPCEILGIPIEELVSQANTHSYQTTGKALTSKEALDILLQEVEPRYKAKRSTPTQANNKTGKGDKVIPRATPASGSGAHTRPIPDKLSDEWRNDFIRRLERGEVNIPTR